MSSSSTDQNPIEQWSIDDVKQAATVVQTYAHRTPLVSCQSLDDWTGYRVFLKCENLQKVGAFKFRGAIHAISKLDDQQKKNGVITHSSGNHGQALALAAKMNQVEATVVMPKTAPQVKIDGVAGYGANVILCEPTLEARDQGVEKVRSESGATFIPPFDHPDIILGQGTTALEMIEQNSELDAIVAPVGGGGLISGTCIVASQQAPSIPVFAAEPQGANDAFLGKNSGERVPFHTPNTIADGLLTTLGDWTWPFVRDIVKDVIVVNDDEIIEAMRFVWMRTKMIIEPSSATAIAALKKESFDLKPESRVGVIITGGNVDLNRLPW